MDVQVYFNLAAGALGALFLFILKTTWDTIKGLQSEIRSTMDTIPKEYVRRDDFDKATDRVLEVMRQYREDQRSALQRIEDKLDKKADKNDVNR